MTREEAIKMVQAHKFPKPTEEWQMLNNEAIDMAIEALQTDEVVTIQSGQTYGKSAYIKELAEVVRCKDCRFAEQGTALSVEETDEGTPRHYIDWVKCHNYDIHKGSMRYVGDDDYCSWGERKGGEDE